MPTTFNAFYLGNSTTALDPTEGNTTAENAGSFVGRTYGGLGNTLTSNRVVFTSVNRGGNATALDMDNNVVNDRATITRNGVTQTYTFDGTAVYTATLTYTNGTVSAPLEVVIVQMTNGNLYLVPSPTAGTDTNTALVADQIRSITLTALVGSNYAGMASDRPLLNFVTCFTRGTRLATPDGTVAVERVCPGDVLLTADHGPQVVRWVGMRRLSRDDLQANPNLAPIRIRAGALGPGLPSRDLTVSPQHRMLVRSPIVARMAGTAEALVAAKHLIGMPGIEILPDTAQVDYWHVLFDRHEIVFAEDAPAESLYLGPQAIEAMSADSLAEITALFPDLMQNALAGSPPPGSRTFLPGRVARKLAERHAANAKALLYPPHCT